MYLMRTTDLLLTDFISLNAKWYPDKTAIIFGEYCLSWQSFNQRINRIANSLIENGVKKGDKVAILNDNCLEYPEMMFGIMKAGAAVVPISTMISPEVIISQLADVQAKALFLGSQYLSDLEKRKMLDNLGIKNCIVLGPSEERNSYDQFIAHSPEEEPNVSISYDDDCSVLYSSGTTGIPKGIVHSHYARVFFAFSLTVEFRVHNQSITVISTPFYTNGSQLLFLPTMLACGTIVIMPKFDAKSFLKTVQNQKCTHAFMVPTQFIRLLSQPELEKYDSSSMEVMVSGAAPLAKKTKLEILAKFSEIKLIELYGATEGIATILRPDEQFSKLGSVGKPRIGGDIRIIDDSEKELPYGEKGEIVGINGSIMKGYYKKPEMTREAIWISEKNEKYIKTGDIGMLDENGYLYILDRKKDMIISGGINIFPRDIENIIFDHPDVLEVAVIGIPHEEWGETPLALVVKRNEELDITENEMKEWANNRLGRYQKVSSVEFRESLPKNALGKVLKRELREPYWSNFKE